MAIFRYFLGKEAYEIFLRFRFINHIDRIFIEAIGLFCDAQVWRFHTQESESAPSEEQSTGSRPNGWNGDFGSTLRFDGWPVQYVRNWWISSLRPRCAVCQNPGCMFGCWTCLDRLVRCWWDRTASIFSVPRTWNQIQASTGWYHTEITLPRETPWNKLKSIKRIFHEVRKFRYLISIIMIYIYKKVHIRRCKTMVIYKRRRSKAIESLILISVLTVIGVHFPHQKITKFWNL